MTEWWTVGILAVIGAVLIAWSFAVYARRRPSNSIPVWTWQWIPWRDRLASAEVLRAIGFVSVIFANITTGRGTSDNPAVAAAISIAVAAGSWLPASAVIAIHNRRVRRKSPAPFRE